MNITQEGEQKEVWIVSHKGEHTVWSRDKKGNKSTHRGDFTAIESAVEKYNKILNE